MELASLCWLEFLSHWIIFLQAMSSQKIIVIDYQGDGWVLSKRVFSVILPPVALSNFPFYSNLHSPSLVRRRLKTMTSKLPFSLYCIDAESRNLSSILGSVSMLYWSRTQFTWAPRGRYEYNKIIIFFLFSDNLTWILSMN